MPSTSDDVVEEIRALLRKMRKDQRDYLLFRLASEKLDKRDPLEPVEIRRPDGSLFGHIRPLTPSSPEETAEMNRRAKRLDPEAGRSTRELLDRMETGDVEGVRNFIDA